VRSGIKVVAFVLAALLVVALGGYAWASFAASRKLSRTYTVHTVDFPIPFPLPEEEVRRLGLTPDSGRQLARDRALESSGAGTWSSRATRAWGVTAGASAAG
jgi:hypothetical protein